MFRKKRTQYIPLLVLPMVLLVCLFMWTSLGRGNVVTVRSAHGVWDLRDADFSGGTVYYLYGALEMILYEFLDPAEFAAREEETVIRAGHGNAFATSRMTVLLPEGEWFVFARQSLDFAHRLYVNGSFVSQAGVPGDSAKAETAHTERILFTVLAETGSVEIVSQASSYSHRLYGYHHAWHVGGGYLQDLILSTDFMQNIILGCFLALFLIFMLMWVMQKGNKAAKTTSIIQNANFYFALFCLMWFFRTGVTGSVVLTYIMPWMSWAAQLRLEYITIPVSAWLIVLIINALFPDVLFKFFRWLVYAVSFGFSVWFLLADTHAASLVFAAPAHIYTIYGVFILLVIIQFAWKFRRPNIAQAVFFGGIIMFLYTTVRDFLFRQGIVILPPFQTEGVLRMEITEHTFTMIAALMFAFCTAAAVFTANRKENEEINEAMYRAEAESKAKSDFLSRMSHEIRTPMNAVIGMAELVLREADLTPAVREYTSTIKHSGSHLLSIINDILDFSKIESGKIEIVNADYELHSTVNDVVSIINTHLTNPKVRFEAYMEQDIPNRLIGDEVRLRQILLNILSNAVKYTHEGLITLNVGRERADAETITLSLRVKDTGIGIQPENLDNLFGEFSQFDLEKNRYTEGTGLGLAITNNLVKLMGGQIFAESVYGAGSTFTVTLPQKYARNGESQIVKDAEIISFFAAPSAKVLVVDDVPTNLAVAQGLLKPYEVAVTLCENGKDAIQALCREDYDLVFMDYMMPEPDGLETMKAIRSMEAGKYAKLPIIVLTANAVVGARDMLLKSGFDGFLSKPIEVDKLNSILAKWLPAEKQQVTFAPHREEISTDLAIPGVDVTGGIAISDGSVENYLHILSVFRNDGEVKLRQLVKCLESHDLSLYTTYVHALKSACANIGAAGAAVLASDLEAAAFRYDLDFIAKHNDDFVLALKSLMADIDTAISEGVAKSNSDSGVCDARMLKTLLPELKTALENFDAAAIDEASEALQGYTGCDDVGEALKDILQNAFTSKCKQAAGQIDELLKTIQ